MSFDQILDLTAVVRTAEISLSLVCRPPLSRSPRHRFGPSKAFLTLCHSEPRRPPRVKSGAHRGRCLPARQRCYSDGVALSLSFSPVAKISTARILSCNPERPLKTRTYSTQNHKWRPDRAHSCFPRVSKHMQRLATKTATALLAGID